MVEISKVTPKDIPALLRMIGKLCAFHGDSCQMGLAETQERFCDGPLVGFIAYQDGIPVGYAVLEPHWRPMQRGDLLDIAHLFVEEPHRGKGIGHALIAEAKAYAMESGASRLVIGTSPDNPGAAAAYRAMGFSEFTQMPGPRFRVAEWTSGAQ